MSAAEDRVEPTRSPRVQRREPFDGSPRGRVLAATVEVISHGGYRDATVNRVLERARVGWADFSAMFEDLDACLLATLDAGIDCAVARAEAAVEAANGEQAFKAALAAVLEAAAEQPALTHLCLVDTVALGARASERREAGVQRFVRLLERRLGERGGVDGGRAGPPAGLAAEMVVGGVYEVIQRKTRAGETRELPQIAGDLERLWLPALRGT